MSGIILQWDSPKTITSSLIKEIFKNRFFVSELTVPINFFICFHHKDNLKKFASEINEIYKFLEKNKVKLNIALDQSCVGGKNLLKDFSKKFSILRISSLAFILSTFFRVGSDLLKKVKPYALVSVDG